MVFLLLLRYTNGYMINIKKLFDNGLKDYEKYWKIFLLIGLVFALGNVIAQSGSYYNLAEGVVIQDGFAVIVSWFAVTWLSIGYLNFVLNIVDGKQAEFKDIFYGVKSVEQFAYYLLITLVYGVMVAFGFLFLIIPGIIISIGFMFSRYYIAENRLGFENALRSSWHITKGNRWKIFWLGIVTGFFNVIGFLAFGIGLLVTIPMTHLIYARLFRDLEGIPLPDGGVEVDPEQTDKEIVDALIAK